ncbi:MAG: hypothetical protein E6G14_16235 [Actinobacteria bacterium]|nr:MAG: hypothetical protein E6G60_08985 [Actinomycetota bacterium]TML65563.1 MAG: hypothetical protein E6G14_16235 [Actinomycetota bacterium]
MAEEAHERIQVTAPPDVCFGIATDFERYPEWANNVRQVKVLTRDEQGRGSTVEFRVAGLGRSVRQVFAYDYVDAPAALSWHLVEGEMLRRLDGRYGFQPSDRADAAEPNCRREATVVTYDLALEFGLPLPGLVKRQVTGLIMGNALKALKQEAERR